MSLFFLHPIYLYGLIATTVPILIHLLNRRRLKRLRFPAVRFVLLSQRRIARTYRLRHWILLALRTFAVLLLVLLLAHPIFQTGVGLLAAGGPASLALVLDNSLSMKWSDGGEGFKRAKEAARLLISAIEEEDQAAVIPTNPAQRRQSQLRGKRETLLKELDEVQISDGSADFSLALRKAYELVKEPAAQKEIWVITDMALTGWDRFSLSALGQYDPLIPVKIVKVGEKRETLNATIKEISVRGRGVAVGLPIHLEASVANFTDKEIKDLLVQLHLNGQNREQKLVPLPPKGEQSVSFQLKLTRPGSHYASVILKKDGLAGNPAAYFTLDLRDQLKVLLVDGDPQTSLIQSETFFLTRALNPGEERDPSLFLPTVVIPEGLNSVPLESYQVLIFCNVPGVPDALVPRLQHYVRQGGGLLLFLGDRVQTENYNLKLFESASPILPARIGEKRVISEAGGEKIGRLETTHAALQGVADELLKTSLQSIRVRSYFRADIAGGSSLLTLANGDPLLVEKKVGPGRVLLFTTAADHDWSDLPLKTAYLPLMQSLVTYLSADKKGTVDPGITVGAPKKFFLPPSHVGKSLKVIKPDRKEREVTLVADKERSAASFEENDLAGIYRLSLFGSALGQLDIPELYPVNSPFLESRLDTVDERELQAKFNPVRLEVIPLDSLAKGGKRMDLALPLLLLIIATLATEGWLSQRF